MITPVILCGGSGTRLWPRSRKIKPKPFLPLVGDNTLFEAALLRCDGQADFGPAMIVTGAAHLDHVTEQLIDPEHTGIIIEPEGKNTAAAIALAALRLPADAIMLVCPSDHHIGDVAAFQSAARAAAALAAKTGWSPSASPPPRPKPAMAISSRARRSTTARATASNASSKARSGPRARLPGRWRLFLERRHLRLPRRSLPR
jgi:mannose-1-phosphate guanylyltransferase